MCAWPEILPQVEITLNLLRESTNNPRVSAWENLFGPYNYEHAPLAPIGTAVTIHEKPDQRASWASHGVAGFYLGPAPDHHKCYKVWATHSSAVRVTDTLAWHPKGYAWETFSVLDIVKEAAEVLGQTLQQLSTSSVAAANQQEPLNNITLSIITQLGHLQDIFRVNQEKVQSGQKPTEPAQQQRVPPILAPQQTEAAPQQRVPPVSVPQQIEAAPQQRVPTASAPQNQTENVSQKNVLESTSPLNIAESEPSTRSDDTDSKQEDRLFSPPVTPDVPPGFVQLRRY